MSDSIPDLVKEWKALARGGQGESAWNFGGTRNPEKYERLMAITDSLCATALRMKLDPQPLLLWKADLSNSSVWPPAIALLDRIELEHNNPRSDGIRFRRGLTREDHARRMAAQSDKRHEREAKEAQDERAYRRGLLRRDPVFNAEKLLDLAKAMNEVPSQHTRHITEGESVGSRLLCEAIANGAFSESKWMLFKQSLHNYPTIVQACDWLRKNAASVGLALQWPNASRSDNYVVAGCPLLAGLIQNEAAILLPTDAIHATPIQARPEHDVELRRDHHDEILQALLELQALDQSTRKTTSEIARKALPPHSDPALLKESVSQLRQMGLIATKRGRTGGAWLTSQGKKSATAISKR